jgi:hypothetical protein
MQVALTASIDSGLDANVSAHGRRVGIKTSADLPAES